MDHTLSTPPDKIFLWDSEGTYVSYYYLQANPKHFVGPQGFLNKPIREVLPGEMADRLMAALEACLRSQCAQICHLELPLDGQPFRQLVRLTPYADRVLGLVYDYPEAKDGQEPLGDSSRSRG